MYDMYINILILRGGKKFPRLFTKNQLSCGCVGPNVQSLNLHIPRT